MSSSSSFYLALHFLYADEYELIMKLFRNFGKLAVIQEYDRSRLLRSVHHEYPVR